MTDKYEDYEQSTLGVQIDEIISDLNTIKWSGNKKTAIDWVLDKMKRINKEAYAVWQEAQRRKVTWVKGKVCIESMQSESVII